MNPHVQEILKLLPARPGIYQMFDTSGKILYVGKSVHLKNRVSSYFNGNGKLNAAKSQMVKIVRNIEWIETSTEIEALVLETNLIKKHRPKYNILMKDDKNLSYIVFSGENFGIPEVFRTRQKPEKGTFFGPYAAGANIGMTLRHLRQIFKVRSCKMRFGYDESGKLKILAKAGRTAPCIDYYIGLCPAPCLLETEKIEAHKKNADNLKKFLRGQMSEVITELREKMMQKAKLLEFEEAGKIKSQIESIEMLGQKQVARDAVTGAYDSILLLDKYGKTYIGRTEIRNGEIQGTFFTIAATVLDETPEEILEQYIAENYETTDISGLTILLENPPIEDTILKYLAERKIRIEIPEQGVKSDLLKFGKTNLMNFAYRDEMENLTKKTLTRGTMESILGELGLSIPKKGPLMFECYDNSHINGQFTVASRSVIVNGKAESNLYRKYKLKTLEEDKIDDFESMREIMERRTIEGLKQKNFPTMIIIDGGKGQLSSALEGVDRGIKKYLLEEVSTVSNTPNSGDVPVLDTTQASEETLRETLPHFCSLAKRDEEIFLPDISESVRFDVGSSELMLLQKIRDEAHRFAISFNRSSREKAMKKNILEELPGFGPVTRKKLLALAGSIDGITKLSKEEISSVCSTSQIEVLVGHGLYFEDKKEE